LVPRRRIRLECVQVPDEAPGKNLKVLWDVVCRYKGMAAETTVMQEQVQVRERQPRMVPASPSITTQLRAVDDGAAARKNEAQRWLDALPIRVVLRRGARGGTGGWDRLVMYRVAANTQEFWEKTWLVSPCFRMRGYTLPRWYKEVFTRRLPRQGLIVEAGCGNGNLVRMLLNEGIVEHVEGLDFAPDVIAENRRVHPEGAKGSYRVGDVRALPYNDGSITGYLSMGVVEHFDEAERGVILREAARCLRVGGRAIITVPYFSPARRIRALLGGFETEADRQERIDRGRERGRREPDDGAAFYQFYFTASEICDQIERAGLRVKELDGYDCRRGWTDAFGGEEAVAWLEKRGPRAARWIEQPPRPLRRFSPHMLMVIAEKA
jgi:SAM-dependent methyltransferase